MACNDARGHLKLAREFCPDTRGFGYWVPVADVVVSAPDFHVGSRGFDPWVCVTVSV